LSAAEIDDPQRLEWPGHGALLTPPLAAAGDLVACSNEVLLPREAGEGGPAEAAARGTRTAASAVVERRPAADAAPVGIV
jgi:hypothetical protein